ncbi:MAG TPA: hypothetical protein VGP07_24765 [Polyangia bacterium]|jgi:hypothetical protein
MKRSAIVLMGALVLAAGCGSGSSGTPGGGRSSGLGGTSGGAGGKSGGAGGATACVAVMPAGSSMSWVDNGTAECAYIIESGRTTDATQDFLEIIGATTGGLGFGLTVVSYTTPLAGVYHCSGSAPGSQYVAVTYSGTQVDCTITVDNPGTPGGANATGSFSATFAVTGGTSVTTTVTSGLFDTAVTAADD